MAEARYDAVAEFYVSGFDSLDDPPSEALLELLGPPAGLRILDVGCGHGRVTRELARRGACLTGIDRLDADPYAVERGCPGRKQDADQQRRHGDAR